MAAGVACPLCLPCATRRWSRSRSRKNKYLYPASVARAPPGKSGRAARRSEESLLLLLHLRVNARSPATFTRNTRPCLQTRGRGGATFLSHGILGGFCSRCSTSDFMACGFRRPPLLDSRLAASRGVPDLVEIRHSVGDKESRNRHQSRRTRRSVRRALCRAGHWRARGGGHLVGGERDGEIGCDAADAGPDADEEGPARSAAASARSVGGRAACRAPLRCYFAPHPSTLEGGRRGGHSERRASDLYGDKGRGASSRYGGGRGGREVCGAPRALLGRHLLHAVNHALVLRRRLGVLRHTQARDQRRRPRDAAGRGPLLAGCGRRNSS